MRSRLRCTTSGGGENSTGTMGIFAPALTFSTIPRIILNQSLIPCYSFPVFIKFQSRRPPLFSFIGEVPIRSGSPSLALTAAHIPPSRHTLARDEKQPLLSSSKTRLYKPLSHRDARKSFRIGSYVNCRESPAISRSARSAFSGDRRLSRPSRGVKSLFMLPAFSNYPLCFQTLAHSLAQLAL